jgi:hypothetical protein
LLGFIVDFAPPLLCYFNGVVGVALPKAFIMPFGYAALKGHADRVRLVQKAFDSRAQKKQPKLLFFKRLWD